MFRLCLGLGSITVSLFQIAQTFGLVPDRERAVIDGRVAVAEVIAVQCAQAAQRNDLKEMEGALSELAVRHPDLLAAAVRLANGRLAIQTGNPLAMEGIAERKASSPN